MTLVSDIIQRAYRVSNLIPLGATPNTNQTTEGLAHLNNLLLSTVGNEAGDGFVDVTIGGTYDQSDVVDQWVPGNVRLLLNLTEALNLPLHPKPTDGMRFSLVDVDSNLATYNVTLDGNGRNIEGAATLTLNTDDLVGQWMYRADTANWVRIETLDSSDSMPFPQEFDDYFTIMLALRLNPSYGQELSPSTLKMLARSRSQLTARYSQTREILSDIDWRSIPSQRKNYSGTNADDFDTGRVYPWM